jgi:SpoVK/Ycf46/Vps4 family AAA+-type ATPase
MSNINNSIVWTCDNNGKDFYPSRPVTLNIPNGIYNIKFSPEYGSYLSLIEFNDDKSVGLLDEYFEEINDDFNKFLSLEEKYKKAGMEFNRAILLHGHPGCGKKYLAKRLGKSFDGITLYADEPEDLKRMISLLKTNNNNIKILVIIEEIGVLLEKAGVSSVMDIFKSKENYDGIYVLSTTNFEEKVDEYLSNRPGVFEEKILVDYPEEEDRLKYISHLIKSFEIDVDKKRILKISKDTKSISLGHIKNLIESVFLYDYHYEDKLEDIKTAKENLVSSLYSSNNMNGIGFGD